MKYILWCLFLLLSACEGVQEQTLPPVVQTPSSASAPTATQPASSTDIGSTPELGKREVVVSSNALAKPLPNADVAKPQPVVMDSQLDSAAKQKSAPITEPSKPIAPSKSTPSSKPAAPAVVADESPLTLPDAELVPRQPVLVDEKPAAIAVQQPSLPEVARVGDAGRGQVVAKKCAACHTLVQGGPHKVGPNLFGIIGKRQGGAADYSYGSYLAAQQGIWDKANLRAWINDSKGVAKAAGATTKMPSQKISGEKADDLLAYLRTLR